MTLRQKAQKALWFFIALLAATTAAAGARKPKDTHGPDSLFEDDFFQAPFDPFREVQEMERRMEMPAVSAKTKETGKEVVVELSVPGLDKDSLDISVNGSGIRIACDARTVQDKQDGSGREVFHGESTRHFERVFPIPDDADGRRSRIERRGDVVKIIFPRREQAVKADA